MKTMMSFEEFVQEVKKSVEILLGDTYDVIVEEFVKTNDIKKTALIIGRRDNATRPAIYMEGFYESYISNETDLLGVAKEVFTTFKDHKEFDASEYAISHFDEARDKIMFKIIHTASNEELLKDVPYVPFLNLAIVFYLSLERKEQEQMTAMIHQAHINMWNVTAQDLMEVARVNTPAAYPATIRSMDEVMKEIMREQLGDNYSEELANIFLMDTNTPLYVLSNPTGINGACCMLYPDVVKEFADRKNSDLIILPSSIHEVLITFDNDAMSYENYTEMVTSINEAEVAPSERLTNSIYLFSRETGKITLVER